MTSLYDWRYGPRGGRGHDIVARASVNLTDRWVERGTCVARYGPDGPTCGRSIHRQHGGSWRHNPRPYGR